MIFRVIDGKKAGTLSVSRRCALFGVSTSGFYAWKRRKPCQRQLDNLVFLVHIRAQFHLSRETYGSLRMYEELREAGLAIGRHRVARLMRENGLNALQKRRFKRTTNSGHGSPVAANMLDQDFSAEAPNEKWGGGYFLYLDGGRLVVSGHRRRSVFPAHRRQGPSDRMKASLATTALKRAVILRQPPEGIIHHSDRGSQYCSGDYQKLIKNHGIIPSMSGKGSCYDNAMVETVFKTIKSELIWQTAWQSRRQAHIAIGRPVHRRLL